MGYFPMCIDLTGKVILLVGDGPQTADKAERLRAFGGEVVRLDHLNPGDLDMAPTMVIVGDLSAEESARISRLCRERRIPVNVVDDPANSTFFFPAMITHGPLTVSVSTGGHAPGAAACLSRRIREDLPEDTDEILLWLHALRKKLYAAYSKDEAHRILKQVTEEAFTLGRCLTKDEILSKCGISDCSLYTDMI